VGSVVSHRAKPLNTNTNTNTKGVFHFSVFVFVLVREVFVSHVSCEISTRTSTFLSARARRRDSFRFASPYTCGYGERTRNDHRKW